MIRSDGAKESYDCSLLISLCGDIVVHQQLLLVSLQVYPEKPQTLLVLIFRHLAEWAKTLLKEAMVSPSYFIQNSTQ